MGIFAKNGTKSQAGYCKKSLSLFYFADYAMGVAYLAAKS